MFIYFRNHAASIAITCKSVSKGSRTFIIVKKNFFEFFSNLEAFNLAFKWNSSS